MFTDTDGQVYHITVEGNTVKDGARIPPDVSPNTVSLFIFCLLTSYNSRVTSRSSTLIFAQSRSYLLHIDFFPFRYYCVNPFCTRRSKSDYSFTCLLSADISVSPIAASPADSLLPLSVFFSYLSNVLTAAESN